MQFDEAKSLTNRKTNTDVRLDVTYSQFRRCIGLGAPVIVSCWPCTCCLLLACSIPQRYWSVHLYSVTCVG